MHVNRYRKLALKFHPDNNANDQVAQEKFRMLAEAFDILSDGRCRQPEPTSYVIIIPSNTNLIFINIYFDIVFCKLCCTFFLFLEICCWR